MRKIAGLVLGVSLGVALFLAGKWTWYVTTGANPHDAEGTSLNAMMPKALSAWGCGQLHRRFPDAIAPDGCKAGDGASWRD